MCRRFKAVATGLLVLAIANFVAFVVGALLLGGDAINGKVENGRYYLMTGGKYTQVSHRVWTYSRIHAISVFITHPLGIGAIWLAESVDKRRKKRSVPAPTASGDANDGDLTPFNQERALHLLFRTITPAQGDPADDLVARLVELRQARRDVLTEDEYDALRSELLRQIAERVRMPWIVRFVFAGMCMGLTVFAIISTHLIVGGLTLVIAAFMWYRMERDYMIKRQLDVPARRRILERLHDVQLVTDVELVDLQQNLEAQKTGQDRR